MENYSLQSDESVIYKGDVSLIDKNGSTNMILTNLNIVLVTKNKKLFQKEEVEIETYPIEDIKIYDNVPQIKIEGDVVEIYFTSIEKKVRFYSKIELHKFVNAAVKLLTGKSMAKRGAEKIKSAVNLVDNTLGINTIDTVKNVIENGVTGTILGAFGKKSADVTESGNIMSGAIKIAKKFASDDTSDNEKAQTEESLDNQIETIKKLKELLEVGVLTQEEFDIKKKEILGL